MKSNMSVILSVDCVLVTPSGKVALIRRGTEPYIGKLALPGGKVETTDGSLAAACVREVAEELGVALDPARLGLLTILDAPGRDPRPGMRISVVFRAFIPEEEVFRPNVREVTEVVLCSPSSLGRDELAFDHFQVLHLLV
jgi:8-oxo-dGTP diphosphatase